MLLDHMRQLVRKQPTSLARAWGMLAGAKDHVVAHGEGLGALAAGSRRGLRARVDAHRREIEAESGFEERQWFWIKLAACGPSRNDLDITMRSAQLIPRREPKTCPR